MWEVAEGCIECARRRVRRCISGCVRRCERLRRVVRECERLQRVAPTLDASS